MSFLNIVYAAIMVTTLLQGPPAGEWSKRSVFSTNHQVEFPGIVLEAGDYIVRLGENDEKRGFVQVLNRDETQILATVVAIRDHRIHPEDSGEFTFHEVQNDGPQPVQSWFYSGDPVGFEFVYPKIRAKEIARESKDRVIASNSDKGPVVVAVTPKGKELAVDSIPAQVTGRKPQ
jgi:hypothetical protein